MPMLLVESVQDIFRKEWFVRVTKGECAVGYYRKFYGRLYRWIYPGEYFYLSALWKAHHKVNDILATLVDGNKEAREGGIQKLCSFREALQRLSPEEHRERDDLIKRINALVVKIQASLAATPAEMVSLVFSSQDGVSYGQQLGRDFAEQHRGKDISLDSFFGSQDQYVGELKKKNLCGEDIVKGFFSQLQESFPDHHAAFEGRQKALVARFKPGLGYSRTSLCDKAH